MRIAIAAIAAFATAAIASPASAAACRITQLTVPGIAAVYDPFDENFTPPTVQMSVQTSGDCTGARIEFALGPTPSNPETGAKAKLVQGASSLFATVMAGGQPRPIVTAAAAFRSNPLSLPIGSAGQITGDPSLALTLDRGQVAPPGLYAATLAMFARLIDADGRQSTSDSQLNLSVSVKPSVRLAAGAGQLSIDLGELRPGAVGGPVGFDAYANADYTVQLRSDNGFVMRRGGTGTAPGVPYTPTLTNGTVTTVANEGATAIRQAFFDAPASGMRHHALRVTVNAFAALAAGQYSDVMTLEIRARI